MPPQKAGTGPAARVVLTFPTTGKGPKEWELTEEKLAEYQGDYPALDVLGEFRKARSFCENNPGRRKTARGMGAFLTGWLNRSTNSGRGIFNAGGNGAGNQRSPRPSSRVHVESPPDDAERRRQRIIRENLTDGT